jgi:hypothetical protein
MQARVRFHPRVVYALALLAALGSCADDDGACGPKPLEQLCSGHCPADKAEAVDYVCDVFGANPTWSDAPNDCGGTNVLSGPNFTGVMFYFDADDDLVGGSTFTDTNDVECDSFVKEFGKTCKATRKFTEHDCPEKADAGAVP